MSSTLRTTRAWTTNVECLLGMHKNAMLKILNKVNAYLSSTPPPPALLSPRLKALFVITNPSHTVIVTVPSQWCNPPPPPPKKKRGILRVPMPKTSFNLYIGKFGLYSGPRGFLSSFCSNTIEPRSGDNEVRWILPTPTSNEFDVTMATNF